MPPRQERTGLCPGGGEACPPLSTPFSSPGPEPGGRSREARAPPRHASPVPASLAGPAQRARDTTSLPSPSAPAKGPLPTPGGRSRGRGRGGGEHGGAIVSVITGPPAHIPTLPSDEPAPRAPRPSSQPREPAPDAPRRTGPQAPGLALGGSPPDFLLLITGATGPVVTVTTARAPARGAVETRPAHAAPRRGLAVASLCRAQGWHRASALGALGGGSLGAAGGGTVRRGVSPAPPHPSRATPTPVGPHMAACTTFI